MDIHLQWISDLFIQGDEIKFFSLPLIMVPPVRVLIIGHSFVRRLEEYVSHSNLRHNMGLSTDNHLVSYASIPGGRIDNITSLFTLIESTRPDMIVIDVGTNDLDSSTPAHLLARRLVNLATHIHSQFNITQVVVLEVLFRTLSGRYSPQSKFFNARVHQFNNMCRSLICRNPSATPLSFRHHYGMVDDWQQYISDGVHLNNFGLFKYFRSIRSVIIRFTNVCLNLRPPQFGRRQ